MTNSFNKETVDNSNKGEESQGASFRADQDSDQSSNGGDESAINKFEEKFAKLSQRLDDSQSFIETLKAENAEMRKALSERSNPNFDIDDIVEQVRNKNPNHIPVDADKIADQAAAEIEKRMSAKERAKQEKANLSYISDILEKQFGDKVDEEVKKLAAKNDMSFDEVYELAKRKPKAALNLLGVSEKTEQPASSAPSKSSVNPYNFRGTNQDQPGSKKTIMDMRTDRDRAEFMLREMTERLAKL